MLPDKNPTVRKFPRTLREAFPNSIETAQWMEHYIAPATTRDVAWYLGLFSIATGMAAVIAWTW